MQNQLEVHKPKQILQVSCINMVGYKRDRNTQNPHTQSHIQTYVPGVEGFWEIKGDAAKQNTRTNTQDAAAEQMPKERPKTESGFHFERHYLLTLKKQKWRRRSSQIQFSGACNASNLPEFC